MSKKAAFITIHVGFNFGSKFQTIATQEVLLKAGCDEVVCVNYVPPRASTKRYWKEAFQSPVRFVRRTLFYPLFLYSVYKYDGYLKRHCNISRPIYADDDFQCKCPHADVYISGSDQIWNYKHNEGVDKHYFFDGISGKKIAYASSIGQKELPHDYSDYMKSQLLSYSAISVREDSAVELLKGIGVAATHVLDPTLMLNKEEWKKYSSKRLIQDPYIFVYLPYNIENKDTIYKTVRKIAEKKGLKVVSYSDFFIEDKEADKTLLFVTPDKMLSLFYYADTVVTNSFHGTAFSINLNKQFWAYLPSRFSTRIKSLLDLCFLNRRLLSDVISDSRITEEIDFGEPNYIINKERDKALSFLIKALQ